MVKNTDCHFGGRVGISSFTVKYYKSDKQSAISDHLLECSTDFNRQTIVQCWKSIFYQLDWPY